MTGFILRRILAVIPTLLGVTVVIFLMLAITPGDPAELLLGERATPESLDAMREYLGLKEPLYVQYGLFLKRVVKFDLGYYRSEVSQVRTLSCLRQSKQQSRFKLHKPIHKHRVSTRPGRLRHNRGILLQK